MLICEEMDNIDQKDFLREPLHCISTWLTCIALNSLLVNRLINNKPSCRYINSGWYNHGEPGFDDVVPDNCDITMAEAFGPGFNEYDQKCAVYTAISAVPLLINFYFLKVVNDLKDKVSESESESESESGVTFIV